MEKLFRSIRVNSLTRRKLEDNFRRVHLNDPTSNLVYGYTTNTMSTSKYTLVTFLPKNLFEQFRRVPNVYFLLISILQLSTDLSPTNKLATIGPLSFVIILNMVKEAYEDWNRHKADEETNRQSSQVLRGDSIESIVWKDIVVGDIIKLEKGQVCPADIVVLQSSLHTGVYYIETANLDGETNLKIQYSVRETQDLQSLSEMHSLKGRIESEHPNTRLYSYSGNLMLDGKDTVSLNAKNLMLRGTNLRHTPFIYGVVVNTGSDTKLLQNARGAPSKRSHLESLINVAVIYIFITLAFLCLYFMLSHIVWWRQRSGTVPYLDGIQGDSDASGLSFITFLILFNNLAPISLYVSMEIVRLYQARFIDYDKDMFDKIRQQGAKARTSNLNEELGQVQYILTDKTGTLTCNEMKLLKCIVGSEVMSVADLERNLMTLKSPDIESSNQVVSFLEKDNQLVAKNEFLEGFAHSILLCHSAVPSKGMVKSPSALSTLAGTVETSSPSMEYRSSSPDEVALLNAMSALGFVMESRSQEEILLNLNGAEKKFSILNVNEFNSNRKRMSIIVRDQTNRIILFCKGADSVMMDLLSMNQPYATNTISAIEEFAEEGMRTLVMAMKHLEESQYEAWNNDYLEASQAHEKRDEAMDEVAIKIEKDLTLLGATAVEDRLQDQVPETIELLMKAGIKIWMLTGDKQETAINIAYSTRLFKPSTSIVKLNQQDSEKIISTISSATRKLETGKVANMGLVVDGITLQFIMNDQKLVQRMNYLSGLCSAVIACRVSPSQKAYITKMVKGNGKQESYVLSVGDGGNDVNMIQEAHIGVGISGKEGMQAVQSSDFSIQEFKHLSVLLLKHGKWNYHRMCIFVLYSFYKNAALVTVLCIFTTQTGYSGTTLFESWLGALWNVVWTFLPAIVHAIVDKDISFEAMLKYPSLYAYGSFGLGFSVSKLMKWVGGAFFHGTIVYYINSMSLQGVISPEGLTDGIFTMGTIINCSLMVTVNMKIILESQSITKPLILSILFSILAWFIFVFAYSYIDFISMEFYGEGTAAMKRPAFWFLWIFSSITCTLFDLTFKAVNSFTKPSPIIIAREIEQFEMHKDQPNGISTLLPIHPGIMSVPEEPKLAFVATGIENTIRKFRDPSQSKSIRTSVIMLQKSPLKALTAPIGFTIQSTEGVEGEDQINVFTLEFTKDSSLEKNFQAYFHRLAFQRTKYTWVIAFLLSFAIYIFNFRENDHAMGTPHTRILPVLASGAYTIYFIAAKKIAHYQELILIFYMLTYFTTMYISSWPEKVLVQSIKPLLGYIAGGLRFKNAGPLVTIDCLIFIIMFLLREPGLYFASQVISLLIFIWAIATYGAYFSEVSMRNDFILQRKLRKEKQITRDILENMLPPFIVNKMQDSSKVIANTEPSVTVLFCEILDFANMVVDSNDESFISLLDDVFSHFDELCIKHDVQKIETVGPIFMACAGLQNPEANHALLAVKLAENMLEDCIKFRRTTGESIKIRIGINTGPAVSGVVGKKKPQYCLFGDTVNTASRMESTAPISHIQVTASTYRYVHTTFKGKERSVFAKGKGELKTYLIEPRFKHRTKPETFKDMTTRKASIIQQPSYFEKYTRDDEEDAIDSTQLNAITLRFKSAQQERYFREKATQQMTKNFFLNMLLFSLLFACSSLYEIKSKDDSVPDKVHAIRGSLLIYLPIAYVLMRVPGTAKVAPFVTCLGYLQIAILLTMNSIWKDTKDRMGVETTLGVSQAVSYFINYGGLKYYQATLLSGVMVTLFSAISASRLNMDNPAPDSVLGDESPKNELLIIFILVTFLLNALAKYSKELYARRLFLLEASISQEMKASSELLSSMAPPSVLGKLMMGEKVPVQKYENVAILCSDIAGFTLKSSQSDPYLIVELLSTLFSHFDILTSIHEVYKVQTIGDAYIAVAGIPMQDVDEEETLPAAQKMMEFAISMLNAISQMVTPDGDSIKLRIGLHYGKLLGGVLGSHSIRFDIWGRDVLVATMMESKGCTGKLHMSEAFKAQIEGLYPVVLHDQVKLSNGEDTWTYMYDPSEDR